MLSRLTILLILLPLLSGAVGWTGNQGGGQAHATTHEPGGADALAVNAAAGTGSLRSLGSGATNAAAGNDSRFPTSGEKSALAGTSGTPGSGNRFVTDADSRLTTTYMPGAFKNLVVTRASNSAVTVTADFIILSTADGSTVKLFSSVSETVDLAGATGANGPDVDALEAANTFFYVYLIGKADGTIDGLISGSPASPTLPTGYTLFQRVQGVLNDNSSHIVAFRSVNKETVCHLPQSGWVLNAGSSSTPADVDFSSHVPSGVSLVRLRVMDTNTAVNGTTYILSKDTGGVQAVVGGFTNRTHGTVTVQLNSSRVLQYNTDGTSGAASYVLVFGWREP